MQYQWVHGLVWLSQFRPHGAKIAPFAVRFGALRALHLPCSLVLFWYSQCKVPPSEVREDSYTLQQILAIS